MSDNPFIKKANDKKSQSRRTATTHVRELQKLLGRSGISDAARRKLETRLEEAKDVAKSYA